MPKTFEIINFKNISEDVVLKNLSSIFLDLLNDVKLNLNTESYYNNIKISIIKQSTLKDFETEDIFKIGINRYVQNNILIIEINEKYKKFIKFILIREIYNLFIPKELRGYDWVQIIINQIIITKFSKTPNINEWKTLIRENLKHPDLLSRGFNRLIDFDRLEGFFKLKSTKESYNPIQFFFHYLRRNATHLSDNIKDVHDIFLFEFVDYVSRSMKNDEIIETIRCLIYIFYKIKRYRDLLSYQKHFQDFKEKSQIITELSLRKFTNNMNWIKKFSYIAPTYQLNWNAINVCVIVIFLRFNPKLNKTKIFKIIEKLPFLLSPKISTNSFSLDICGYVIVPYNYLNDFISLIRKLRIHHYITNYNCLLRIFQNHMINLNYFREYSQNLGIINPSHKSYDEKYEIDFHINFGEKFYNQELSLLDFLIFDRIRWFSVNGFGFERNTELLNVIKSDLINESATQRSYFKNLKNILNDMSVSNELKKEFLDLLDKNKNLGFFWIKENLEIQITILKLIESILISKPDIKKVIQLREFIKKQNYSNLIENNIILNNKDIIDLVFKSIISDFFHSKTLYKQKVEKLQKFYELIKSCFNLKLFDLNAIGKIITDYDAISSIYKLKADKLKKLYDNYKLYNITTQEVDDILDKFINNKPPILSPLLINTILTFGFEKDYLQLILIDSQESRKKLKQIKLFFPRILINNTKDLITNKNYIYVEISTPKLNHREKLIYFSIIHNLFKDHLISGKNYIWSGGIKGFSIKNFYDFKKKEFFYTKDLFEQYFLYVGSVLGDRLEEQIVKQDENSNQYWSKQTNISQMVKKVNNRISKENIDFNLTQLDNLLAFNLNLNLYLLNEKEFQKAKKEYSFTNYVKSIKFLPALQYFGLGQYYLYLYPLDINEIDFKLLLTNTFQNIKFPACIDSSNSFLIKYIMPYGDPNKAYLNWLVKSKKVIREYCGFFIKKIHHPFQFNLNITSEGWNYSAERFKAHLQNILFNKDNEFQIPGIKEFNLSDNKDNPNFGPNSPEYKSLTNIYNWRPLDIKSYLGTLKYYPTENFTDLIKKGLIFPYLSLKNLDLQDKLYIIIPNLKEELNRTLIDIFSFFNYGFIYETEGEYFIHGFPEETQFKNGMMIKLYLPDCELSEFIHVFDLLFEYLEIKDYLILNDLVDGSNLLKSVFGELKFLDSYNPLKNLIWNENSKTWENHKLFTPKFEPIYPDLIEKDKTD